MNIWMLSGFSSRDLVVVLINYNEGETERRLVVCSADLPYDSDVPPPGREFEEHVFYYDEKNPLSTHKAQLLPRHTVWGNTKCNKRRAALLEFLNATNLEILNQGSDSTFSEYQNEEVSQSILGLLEALQCGVVLLALRLHHSIINHLCISTLVALLSNGWCQEKIQRLSCLGITGVVRTTPTSAMEALT
jgi:hypothetical protein